MKENVEIKGYWFLPGEPDNRVAGILYFSPNDNPRLELIGSFYSPQYYLRSLLETQPEQAVIYGESSNAQSITLLECHAYGSLNFDSSFPMQSYSVSYVIKGVHLKGSQDAIFDRITVQLPLLTAWVNSYRIGFSIPFENDRPSGFELTYHTADAHEILVPINADLKLELEYSCSPPGTKYEETLVVRQAYQLHVRSLKPLSFLNLVQKTRRFCGFLAFGTQAEIGYESISLFSPDYYQELNDGRKVFHAVELYYNQYTRPVDEKKDSRKFLFTYDKIAGSFDDLIRKWFSFDDQMAPILMHFVSSISAKDIFSAGDFLIVVQALEGYCTRFRPHYPKAKRHITLKEQLTALNDEFSFVPTIVKEAINIDAAVDSRHYYSHFYTKKTNDHLVTGIDLYNLTQKLKKLLTCCVLQETGFSQKQIIEITNAL